jgi:hypothetical protein
VPIKVRRFSLKFASPIKPATPSSNRKKVKEKLNLKKGLSG